MYEALKEVMLDLLNAPTKAPELPAGSAKSVRVVRASPNFIGYRFVKFLILLILLAIGFGVISIALMFRDPILGALAVVVLSIIWLIVGMTSFFLIRLEYDMRYYLIADRSLRIRKGVLNIVEQTLTYVNIQNIRIEQGPLQRAFNIRTLLIDTAGGGSALAAEEAGSTANYHRAYIEGIENAEEIRDLILNYLRQVKPTSGLGEDHELGQGGFGPQEVEALRDILNEVKALRGTSPPSSENMT